MDKNTFIKTVVPLRGRLLDQARRLAATADAADDIVQETFLQLWLRRDALDDYHSAESFARKVLHNKYIDALRRQKAEEKRVVYGLDDTLSPSITLQNEIPNMEPADEFHVIGWIIDHLPFMQREVFRMKEMEGCTSAEIQQITGCSAEAVRQNLSRARKKIRDDYLKLTERRKKR